MAVNCSKCGAELLDNAKFCEGCGQPVEPIATPDPPPIITPLPKEQSQHHYVEVENPPAHNGKYAVIGTLKYFCYMVLMAIPILGAILTIVWAFSGKGSLNKRNFARAVLIMAILCILLSIFGIVTSWQHLSQYIQVTFGQ